MSLLHLVVLTGQGDTTISLVTADQFEWINSPPPLHSAGKSSWIEHDPSDNHAVNVTVGSMDNDRALQVNGIEFGATAAAHRYAKEHNHVISDDEFIGYLY